MLQAEDGQYEVEKGIEIPKSKKGKGVTKYPFSKMEIGDSFLIPKTDKNSSSIQSIVLAACGLYRKRKNNNFKITTRIVDGDIRAWRIE